MCVCVCVSVYMCVCRVSFRKFDKETGLPPPPPENSYNLDPLRVILVHFQTMIERGISNKALLTPI